MAHAILSSHCVDATSDTKALVVGFPPLRKQGDATREGLTKPNHPTNETETKKAPIRI